MTCDHTSYNFTCVQLRNGDHSGTQCTVQRQSVEAIIFIKVCGKLSLGKNWHAKPKGVKDPLVVVVMKGKRIAVMFLKGSLQFARCSHKKMA